MPKKSDYSHKIFQIYADSVESFSYLHGSRGRVKLRIMAFDSSALTRNTICTVEAASFDVKSVVKSMRSSSKIQEIGDAYLQFCVHLKILIVLFLSIIKTSET